MTEDDEDWFESAVDDGDPDEPDEGAVAADDGVTTDDGDASEAGTVDDAGEAGGDGDGTADADGDADDDEDWFESGVPDPDPAGDPVDGASSATATGLSADAGDGAASESAAGADDDQDDAAPAAGTHDAGAGDGAAGDRGGDGGVFDQDFASALEDAPGGSDATPGEFDAAGEFDPGAFDDGQGEFGGPPGGQGDGGFDDEDLDSDIPRIELGIAGLDAMIQGGVPERSLMVAIGSAGTGKTTLGLQFLDRALERDERAIFVTLEETSERVIRSATEKGMAFDEHAEAGRLAVVDMDPVEMANSLASIRSELPRLIDEFGATRLVLDSVSLLEMMYDERAARRNEIYDFTRSLNDAGVTTMLTSEASEDTPYASRHGIVEYLTDAVFVLQYVRNDDFRETRLAVEIQKIRDANHSRETKPYEITDEGISVYRQANIF